ncbi:hypothetical protein O1611_g7500 [Lasiodiplodia mahajangana]|uniref:Uncharacterized protein n=1 Tax=Lasiodiplodia mahajangana TaxID=1108764 RepID=A0ACC2JF50_9PEZI|nr:hypothetical protein O1611_g7500 [Lasiodiplodia mahajangana]
MTAAASLPEIQYLDIPNFPFQDGTCLPVARLAYLDINPTSTKVATIITCFRGRLQSTLNFANGALRNHRIIVVALFGNGESSSPSNTVDFPVEGLSYVDCVRAQHTLLVAHLQLTSVDIMVGFSMGGQCTYHWLLTYPDFVSAAAILCSSARTSRHNYQFLEGPKAALISSVDYVQGKTENASCFRGPSPERGLKAFGKAYSAWLTSAEWFDRELYQNLGFGSLEAWDEVVAGTNYLTWHPDDLLAKLGMWQRGDITGLVPIKPASLEGALGKIKARVLLMPCSTDQYFRWEASASECNLIPDAQLKVIPSVWGHLAGSGVSEEDTKWMDTALSNFL